MVIPLPKVGGWYAVCFKRPDGLFGRDVGLCFHYETWMVLELAGDQGVWMRAVPDGSTFDGPFVSPREADQHNLAKPITDASSGRQKV